MKVCHLDTERSWRGGEQQLLYLALGLRAAADESLIAARAGSALEERAKAAGFEVFPLRPWSEWDPLCALKLKHALVKGRFELLHAHTAHAAALGALATAGTGIPLVIARRVDFHLSKNPLTRWKYKRAAKVLTVSAAIRDVLIEDGLPQDQVSVVYSGVDPARLEPNAPPASREELGLPADGPLVGQVAALAPHKDPLNFLRAVAELKKTVPGVHGVMVGAGPLEREVRAEVSRLGLKETVLLLGFRPDAHRLLRRFDVFVLSSCLEGLGTSILDAMALGIPVAATRTGGIPEMVEDGVTGTLAAPRDPRALAAAIARLLSDAALRGRVKAGGLKTVGRFSVEAMVAATRAAYAQALARPNAANEARG